MFRKLSFVAGAIALAFAGLAAYTPDQIARYCATHNTPACQQFGRATTFSFSDDFNGTALDTSKWAPSWFGTVDGYSHPVNSLEDGCFDTRLVSVSGGALHLGSGTNTDPDCERRDGSTAPYRGSIVSSNGKFSQKYGTFEARVYFPGGEGGVWNWPVFWTDGQHWPADCEFDIAEVGSSHRPSWHVHRDGPTIDGRPNFDGVGWHTYRMTWNAAGQDFFYDGVSVGHASDACGAPHYVIFGNQINQDYGVVVPAEMQVDYVRVTAG